MTEIKPAAWVERTEDGHDRMWSGDLSAWANRPANPEPLYDQATIDALRRDAERYRWLVSQTWAQIAMDFRLIVRQRSHDDVDSYGDAIDAAMNGANA